MKTNKIDGEMFTGLPMMPDSPLIKIVDEGVEQGRLTWENIYYSDLYYVAEGKKEKVHIGDFLYKDKSGIIQLLPLRKLSSMRVRKGTDIDPSQAVKADYGKEQLSLVPRRIIHNIAAIRMYGTEKYSDPENWRQVEPERYRDAAFRHFLAYLDDPHGKDVESGFPHLWHLACNIAFLCEMEDEK